MSVVEVEHLTVSFKKFMAVDDISFKVEQGEIFGFLGANGAGKTTTIRVLCGLHAPTTGRAFVSGHNAITEGELIKRKIGYMSQKSTLYEDLTINENLEFMASLHRLSYTTFTQRRDQLLSTIHFKDHDFLKMTVRYIPSGIRQQVALVASLLHDPLVLFLDEPTAGVSPQARYYFWELIKDLTRKGKTIFVTTHYMDEAEQCDRIALMRSGKILALETPQNLKNNTFPQGLWQLIPKNKQIYLNPVDLIEEGAKKIHADPFGLKYHLTIKLPQEEASIISKLSEFYHISQMAPSLEDVFLKIIDEVPQ